MFRILFAAATSIFVSGCLTGVSGPELSASQTPAVSADASSADIGSDAGLPQEAERSDHPVSRVSRSSVEKSCRSGSSAFNGDGYADCVKQEMEAKQQLAESRVYSTADRQACGSEDSYVEQLTCLQVKDWLRHPEKTVDVKTSAAAKANRPSSETAKSPSSSNGNQP
jgi:hypothetical protein